MKATKQIDIYLTQKRNVRLIDVVQYDTGIQLVFTVKDFTIPSGATATLYVQKPSGKFVYQEDGITVSGSTVTINLHNQAITEHGKVPYQVSLKSGSDVITTFTGLMIVEKSLKDSGATESKTVIRAFDEAVSDHVAEFQTKAEQIVQACIATIPDDYTTMEAKVNELANAIKGNLSGAVVVADDVSPVEHNPVVRVHGKNYFDVSKITGATNIVNNGDGTLSVTSVTDSFSAATGKTLRTLAPALKAGNTYTLSAISDVTTNIKKKMYLSHDDGNMSWMFGSSLTLDETTLDSRVYFYANDKENVTTISNIQIEEGTVATAYEPYIDPTTATVRRCGKNLLNLGDVRNGNGSTSKNENGKFTVTGYFASVNTALLHSGERYTVSFSSTRTGEAGGGISVEFFDETDARITGIYKQNELSATVSFTVPENTVATRFYFYGSGTSTGTDSATYTKMQVECGSDATPYEPYNGTAYIPAADGTVPGVTSLSPSMTILTDTEGVIVECEYNRDTNKVIDKLINAITALGGTV